MGKPSRIINPLLVMTTKIIFLFAAFCGLSFILVLPSISIAQTASSSVGSPNLEKSETINVNPNNTAVGSSQAQNNASAQTTQSASTANNTESARNPDQIELNFNSLDLKTMVDLISKATGTAFLYEENLAQTKKITLLSTGTYKLDDAYKIFENILDINGFTTIKEGPYIRIISKNEARVNQSPIVRSTQRSITQGDFITMIVPVENTDINNIRGAITPFLSPTTLVNQYIPTNLLIIRDTRSIVQKTADLINLLDKENGQLEVGRFPIINKDINKILVILKDVFIKSAADKNLFFHIDDKDYSIIVIGSKSKQDKIQSYIRRIDVSPNNKSTFQALEYVSTSEALKLLNEFFPQAAGAGAVGRSSLSITEDSRSNRLLLSGPDSEIKKAQEILKEIDIPLNNSSTNYRVFYLKNSDAENVAKTLQQVTKSVSKVASQATKTAEKKGETAQVSNNSASTSNSTISIVGDSQTNSIVVFASSSEIKFIEKLISDLDIPRPQVFLEVMIMEVSLDKSLNLGVDWKAAGIAGNTLLGAGLGGASNFLPTTATSLLTEGASANIGFLGPTINYNGTSYSSYSGFIQATQSDTDFNLISNPQILTVANQEATIRVGEVRPFQTATRVDVNNNVTTSYDYKEVGVTLKFTAKIGEDNTVALKIDQSTKNIKETGGANVSNLTPTTIERNINTNVLSKDREIIVLGGLIGESQTSNLRKTICLGDIPILGIPFRNTGTSNNKTNLLVYIKPTIVRTAEERKNLKQQSNYYYQNYRSSNALDLMYDKLDIKKNDSLRKPSRQNLKKVEDLPKILEETANEKSTNKNSDSSQDSKK